MVIVVMVLIIENAAHVVIAVVHMIMQVVVGNSTQSVFRILDQSCNVNRM